jgi:hypothetical protein
VAQHRRACLFAGKFCVHDLPGCQEGAHVGGSGAGVGGRVAVHGNAGVGVLYLLGAACNWKKTGLRGGLHGMQWS